jgi:predicted nucleic acid-binding protein
VTHYLFDSSGLLKRYVPEVGTTWVRATLSARSINTIFIAQITPVEVISAISRRRREGTVTTRTARMIRLLLDRHVKREYSIVELNESVVRRAEDLLERHQLRAYDSVQLASALESNAHLVQLGFAPLVFISSDTRLLAAARAESLIIDDPTIHP